MGLRALLKGRIGTAVVALGAGSLGGGLAFVLGVPLPWLIGSIIACAIAAMFGVEGRVPPLLRTAMLAVIGVLLGSSFSGQFLQHAAGNALAIVFLVPYVVIATLMVAAVLRRTTALDPVTVFFSAVPGGVNEMTLMGTERGGHQASLAVHHSIRLLLVVMVIAFSFALAFGISRTAPSLPPHQFALADYGWTIAFGGAGILLARLIRLPAGFMLGPMVVSAAAHLTGLTDMRPDSYLVILAQIVSGAALGVQFSTFSRTTLLTAGRTAVKIAALLLVFTALFVWLVSLALDRSYAVLMLAYAPGGLAEMGLIALSMNADAAFVSALQVSRFFVVVTLAVPLFKLVALTDRLRLRAP